MLCKILGLIDITSAVFLLVLIPSSLKYLLAVPLMIKGIYSLLG